MCAGNWSRLGIYVLAAAALFAPNEAYADEIFVAVDHATIVRLKAPPAEIVIGNPAYAAVTLHGPDALAITGKAYGETNIIVFDRRGRKILDDLITVVGTRGIVRVNRGGARFSYLCAPVCRAAPQIGDQKEYFEETTKQIQTRNAIAEDSSGVGGG